jgi:hypothetical protein
LDECKAATAGIKEAYTVSKHETAMTEGFWLSQATGLFFEEYALVIQNVDRATRLVDGLILPDEPHPVQHRFDQFYCVIIRWCLASTSETVS